jgi:predicted acyltransferase
LALSKVAESFPNSPAWRIIAIHAVHAEWEGGVLIDLVQPSFCFLVGAALPFSLARRRAQGHSLSGMPLHALWRSVVLVLLGVFLRSVGWRRRAG